MMEYKEMNKSAFTKSKQWMRASIIYKASPPALPHREGAASLLIHQEGHDEGLKSPELPPENHQNTENQRSRVHFVQESFVYSVGNV